MDTLAEVSSWFLSRWIGLPICHDGDTVYSNEGIMPWVLKIGFPSPISIAPKESLNDNARIWVDSVMCWKWKLKTGADKRWCWCQSARYRELSGEDWRKSWMISDVRLFIVDNLKMLGPSNLWWCAERCLIRWWHRVRRRYYENAPCLQNITWKSPL